MLVKYTGRGELISEYNGKITVFTVDNRLKDIPQGAYDEIIKSGSCEGEYLHILNPDEVIEHMKEQKKIEKEKSKEPDPTKQKHADWYVDSIKYQLNLKNMEEAKSLLKEAIALYPENKRLEKLKEFIEQEE